MMDVTPDGLSDEMITQIAAQMYPQLFGLHPGMLPMQPSANSYLDFQHTTPSGVYMPPMHAAGLPHPSIITDWTSHTPHPVGTSVPNSDSYSPVGMSVPNSDSYPPVGTNSEPYYPRTSSSSVFNLFNLTSDIFLFLIMAIPTTLAYNLNSGPTNYIPHGPGSDIQMAESFHAPFVPPPQGVDPSTLMYSNDGDCSADAVPLTSPSAPAHPDQAQPNGLNGSDGDGDGERDINGREQDAARSMSFISLHLILLVTFL